MSSSEMALIREFCAIRAKGDPVPHDLKRQVEQLFAEAQPRVYGICRKLVGDPERAREICQDSMLIGLRKLDNFRSEGRLSTWLYGIARGEALNAILQSAQLQGGGPIPPGALQRNPHPTIRQRLHSLLRKRRPRDGSGARTWVTPECQDMGDSSPTR